MFIDARQIGYMKDRVLRDFTADDIAKIADTLHAWQTSEGYEDQAAFCKSATLEEIKDNDFVLTPGRYVGTAEQEDDGVPFAEKMQNLTALLKEQFAKSAELEAEIKKNLGDWGMSKITVKEFSTNLDKFRVPLSSFEREKEKVLFLIMEQPKLLIMLMDLPIQD